MARQNFILLPVKGTVAIRAEDKTINPKVENFRARLAGTSRGRALNLASRVDKPLPIKVIDSISDKGAQLVELNVDSLAEFQLAYPGMRVVPEVFFKKAILPVTPPIRLFTTAAGVKKKVTIIIVDSAGVAVKGAVIYAYTDYSQGAGADGVSDSKGKFSVTASKSTKKFDTLLVYPAHTYWPVMLKNVSLQNIVTIKLRNIDPTYRDALRHFYDTPKLPVIKKDVRVGVIDSGVGPHTSVPVAGGECLVTGEKKTDHKDYDGHGTHVASIIASKDNPIGVASGVKLFSYRVFPKNSDGASNFFIMRAIQKAVEDGCLLINLSLTLNGSDEVTNNEIAEAYSKGVVCFAATGNDGRQPVSFPAAFSLSIAVSAIGRKGTFPANSEPFIDVKSPYGKDKKNFLGAFSNIGHHVKMTAPGVGIIGGYPGSKLQVLSGTSMACPAATGIAARLLAMEGNIIKRAPNAQRADEIIKFLHSKFKTLGFAPKHEGKGMLFI